ncbi:MAG: sulfatase-like hydrolase/transferase [Chloroflexota bacterium]
MAFELTDVLQSFFIERDNLDFFRFNLEWLLLLLPWVFFKSLRNRFYALLVAVVYLVQLLYSTYEGFIRSYYLLDPTLFNDYFLFNDMTGYVLNNLQISWGIYGLLAVLIIAFLVFLFWAIWRLVLYLPTEQFSAATRIMMVILVAAILLVTFNVGTAIAEPQTAVNSLTLKIWQNNGRSRQAASRANRFDSDNLQTTYQFTTSTLNHRPNIYLIFIESYGSVLYKRRDFNTSYLLMQNELEKRLRQGKWHIASTRSEAPTWGGASWVSYTSAIVGASLESHAEFLAILNQYDDTPFPHLLNYLNSQGYFNLRISSISRELDDTQLSQYKDFYGFDDWLRYSDLDYSGPLYGWGPAVPDQYALNYANDFFERTTDAPHLFFYITQNSHYPWFPLPDIATDWRTINDLPPAPPAPLHRVPHELLRERYLESIRYELTSFVDFILTEGDENDIFVLIGDHQPARVARRADGWDTPLHIISKDQAFIDSFENYAFRLKMATNGMESTIHHEGFYSVFMRVLLEQYGTEDAVLPEFHPTGFELE